MLPQLSSAGGGGTSMLPPLWPGDMFAMHRLHARKLFDELNEINRSDNSSVSNDDVTAYLNRVKDANLRAIRRASTRSFGEEALNATGHGTIRPWVKQICTLVDPYSFPLEGVIYSSQRQLAEALEIIEQNTSTLERYRRDVITENLRLYEEVKRLHSASFTLERLETNLNRVLLTGTNDYQSNTT